MWLDVLLFATGAFAGTPAYLSIMKGTLISRFIISVFAFPFLYFYLYWQNKKTGIEIENRPVLAILKQVAEIELELSHAQQEIERRKKAEKKLAEYQNNLKEIVKERTAELEDTNLRLLREVSERKQTEEALLQSKRELRIRNEINNIFLTHPDEEVYAEILKVILKLMESEYGIFGYFDEDGSFVAPAVTRKIFWDKCNVPEKEIIFQKGTFGGIWGRAIRERKTLISNDGPFKVPEGHIHILNTMVTPIIFRDEVISAIHIANKPDGYGEKDRIMLKTIADNIAPVLYARLQRDGQDKERRKAEEALRESEKKYRNLFENGSDLLCIHDLEGNFLETNLSYKKQYGLINEDIRGLNIRDFIPDRYKPEFDQYLERIIQNGEDDGYLRVIPKYGEEVILEYKNKLMLDDKGRPMAVQGSARDITERKQAEEQIKTSLKEKEILLQEIHHRAKNNMQIISSLLKLQVSSSKDKKVEDALKESHGRVQAMSLVHETLYDTESMASIDFRSYISRLSQTVFQSYGISREQVELKIEAENISFRIDQLSHIGLLINELVSNSLKYAFPGNRKGEIVIRLRKIDQDEIELMVGDNGLGMPEDLDWRNTETLGLQLVTTLAEEQLDGTLNLNRVNGTHFNIRFKLKES
jgi:PAS domain S-box-containing protein